MKAIILTSELTQSENLYKRLCELDDVFKSIPRLTKADLTKDCDCEYIFSTWYMPVFTEEEVKYYFPNLKAIFYAAGTVKNFAEPFLKSGVRVFSAAQANGIPVAEFTVAQIILANKGYFQTEKRYKWPLFSYGFKKIRRIAESHSGNYKSVVGILGCGAIGSNVVELLKSYSIRVKIYDPYISEEQVTKLGVERVGLDELFTSCNIISNHLPDLPSTKGLINKTLLLSMPKNSTLINTGRGAQINEKDLSRVLKKRKDMVALLDVTRHEPLYPWSSLFFKKNVFITPHIAGSLSGEINRMIDFSYNSFIDFINKNLAAGEITQTQFATNA